MRTTSHNVKKLVSHPEKDHPENSNGKDLAETVNGLIDITGILEDHVTEPAPGVGVQVETVYNPNLAYPLGTEMRLKFGFFKCVKEMPAGNNIPITDSNYWDLFYVPDISGEIWGGMYDASKPLFIDLVFLKVESETIKIIKSKVFSDPVPYDANNFEVLTELNATVNDVHSHWRGNHNVALSYEEHDLVVLGTKVYECKLDIEPKAFDVNEWTLRLDVQLPSYKGRYGAGVNYITGDTVIKEEADGNIKLYVARTNIDNSSAFNLSLWNLQETFLIGGRYRNRFDATASYNKYDVITRINDDGEIDVLSAKLNIAAGPFDPIQWDNHETIHKGGEFKGYFSAANTYVADDSVLVADGINLYVYTAKATILPKAFDANDWTQKLSFTKPELHYTKAFLSETLRDDELLCVDNPVRKFQLATIPLASSAVAQTAATGTCVISILKNDTEVGTVTWNAGETEGTFSVPATVNFSTTDLIKLQVKGSADSTLADIAFTLECKVI
ncbi:hypothetical protein SM033_00041 [Vibrio phage vB_VpaM_sm033]|nr:hypothetical protein SM033_00041 [Vibrio phage vB_VpaM_sm033]